MTLTELAELDQLYAALKRARELGEHRLGDSIRAQIVARRRAPRTGGQMTDADIINHLRGHSPSAPRQNDREVCLEAADRLEAIANKLQRMEKALCFYADEWEQDVDAEQTVYGWVGSISEVLPTNNLMADLGATARAALKD